MALRCRARSGPIDGAENVSEHLRAKWNVGLTAGLCSFPCPLPSSAHSFSSLNILQQTQQNAPKLGMCSYIYFKLLIPIVNNSIKYKTSFQSYLEMCYIKAAYFPSSPASKNRTSDAGSVHCASSHLHTYHVQSPTGTDRFYRRSFSGSTVSSCTHGAYFVKWSLMLLKQWRSATGTRSLQIMPFLFRFLQLPQETSGGYPEVLCY